jgi:four helix bundle protein
MVRSYQELVVWQKAMGLVTAIYHSTRQFPKEELYGLTSQLRRSAVSVPSNIAEGQGKLSTGEFVQFLGHARGSLLEAETQIQLAHNLGFMAKEDLDQLLSQSVGRGWPPPEWTNRLVKGIMRSCWPLATGH